MALIAFLLGNSREGLAQSPCYPNLPVTGAYADPATSSSPNAERVLWLTWGSSLLESTTTYPYGKPGVRVNVGSKSYGSIDLGGGRYMCVEAEIILLNGGGAKSYIPGTYEAGANNGDLLDDLYNIGGSGGPNGNPDNKMASGITNINSGSTINMVIRIKATTGGEAVRLRGMVLADAESLDASPEYITASGDGNWSVAEVKKDIGQRAYDIRKANNASGTQCIVFQRGNDRRTGAVAFLTYKNTAYASLADGYAVEFSAEFKGGGNTAIAIGLLTSGYDFGDAPISYGKPIHLIDDLSFASDGIVAGGSTVNVNATGYNPGLLTYSIRRYLGSTAPDGDFDNLFSDDALGDNNSGNAGLNEEDAWPLMIDNLPINFTSRAIKSRPAFLTKKGGWVIKYRDGLILI